MDSPVPYSLDDLLDCLDHDDTEMVAGAKGQKQGPFFGRLTRFVNRMRSRVEDRRHGFMFSPLRRRLGTSRSMDWPVSYLAPILA